MLAHLLLLFSAVPFGAKRNVDWLRLAVVSSVLTAAEKRIAAVDRVFFACVISEIPGISSGTKETVTRTLVTTCSLREWSQTFAISDRYPHATTATGSVRAERNHSTRRRTCGEKLLLFFFFFFSRKRSFYPQGRSVFDTGVSFLASTSPWDVLGPGAFSRELKYSKSNPNQSLRSKKKNIYRGINLERSDDGRI